jgi:Zn-dependent protease/CBS domain-containing protein
MLQLGRIRGVPVLVAPSWLIVGLLLTVIYGPIVNKAVPSVSGSTAYLAALGFSILFGLCILAHELGHTLVSLALGHPVRRVVLFALGGVSEIEDEPSRPRDELLIAATGPLVSLLIAGAAWIGYDASPAGQLSTALLGLLWWSNLVLAIFNLLPGLPLDGGRLLRATVCAFGVSQVNGTRVAAWAGRVVAVVVAGFGLLADRTSLGFGAGIFSVALAAYLWFGATQSLRVAGLFSKLPEVDVTELLRPGLFVPADLTVAEALRRVWNGNARGIVLVDSSERPSAIVDESLIGGVPPDRRPWTPVVDVARPMEPGLMIPDGLDAPALLQRMRATPAHEYLVVRADGSPAGIIATRDFAVRLQGPQSRPTPST